MYDKIEQGKHIKKPNMEVEGARANKARAKKPKEIRIQQLNVEVKSN